MDKLKSINEANKELGSLPSIDEANGEVKKKDFPSAGDQLKDLYGEYSSVVSSDGSEDPILERIKKRSSAPTVDQTLGSTPQSDSEKQSKDLAIFNSWYAPKAKNDDPARPLTQGDIAKMRKDGYGDEQIKILLDEQRKALRENPNYYADLAAEDEIVPEDPNSVDKNTIDFYKKWARQNDQADRVNYLIQKAKSEAIAKGQSLPTNTDVPLDTPTGLKLWEEAMSVQGKILNSAYKDALKNPQAKAKLDRLAEISNTLQNTDPQSDEDIAQYNQMVVEHNELLNDSDVKRVVDINNHFERLSNTEKSLYVNFPSVYKERENALNKQKAIDSMFRSGVMGVQLPSSVFGITSQLGRSLTKLGGDILKTPTIADSDNVYGSADKWRDLVDSTVDAINEDVFMIPSWTDQNKAGDIRFDLQKQYQKKIDEAPEDQKESLKKELASQLNEIGTGEWTYTDGSGNRVFRNDLVLPKLARVAGDMAALLYGGNKISGGLKLLQVTPRIAEGTGLYMSSYLQSHNDYRNAGIEAGLSPEEAAMFAHSSAALTSALELISPNKYLWNKGEVAERVAKGISSGMGTKAATKEAFKFVGKEVVGENMQELSQMIGDKAIEKVANESTGRTVFDQDPEKIKNEAFETALLTTLVAGLPAGAHGASSVANRDEFYNDAIQLVAENKTKMMPLLQIELKKQNASPEYAKKIINDINNVNVPVGKAYKINGEEVDSKAMKEYVETGNKDGIYISNDEDMINLINDTETINTANSFLNSALHYLKGIPKMHLDKLNNSLIESGDVKQNGGAFEVQNAAAARKINDTISNLTGYLPKYHPLIKQVNEIKEQAGKRGALQEGSAVDSSQGGPESEVSSSDNGVGGAEEVRGAENVGLGEDGSQVKRNSSVPLPDTAVIEGSGLDLNNAERVAKTPELKRSIKVLKNVKKAIKKIAPDTRVLFFQDDKAGRDSLKALGYDVPEDQKMNGFHDAANSIIAINVNDAEANTAFHEGIHPVINLLQQKNPEVFKKFAAEAAATKTLTGETYGKLMGSEEEALVELLADVANGKFDSTPESHKGVINKVISFINDVLEKVGLDPLGIDPDMSTLKGYANDIAKAIQQGRPIKGKQTKKKAAKLQSKVTEKERGKGQSENISNLVSEESKFKPLFDWHKNRGGQVKFYGGRGDNEGVATYNRNNDEISININHSKYKDYFDDQGNVDKAIAHEIIHRIIAEKTKNPDVKKSFDTELNRLIQIMNQYPPEDAHVARMIEHINAGSPEELVTYALTDQKVADFLNSIPFDATSHASQTIWDKLKNLILSAVKLDGNKSLLDAATYVLDNYIGDIEISPRKPQYQDRKIQKGNRLFSEPLPEAGQIADEYNAAHGLPLNRGEKITKIDTERAKRIAKAYEAMKDDPTNPEVHAAYEAMAKETIDQFKTIIDHGYTVEVNNNEPYSNSSDMIEDLRDNKNMKIFSTESGFGDGSITQKQRDENPLLQDSGYKDINGVPLLVNDVFRFVHDFFGHAERGNSFGPLGEENAWDNHSRMYTPLARRAMTSETRGQNSYVNFSGINDEAFKLRDEARKLRSQGKEKEAAELTDKVYSMVKFADQKTGLLPVEFSLTDDELQNVEKIQETPEGPVFNITIPDVKFQTKNRIKNMEGRVNRAPLSAFAGKRVTIIPSDRLTTGEVQAHDSKKTYKAFGGIYYPAATNRVWASSSETSAKKIVNNLEFDENGNAYVGIMAMSKDSHMSNSNAVTYSLDAVESAVKAGKVSTADAINKINAALEVATSDNSNQMELFEKKFRVPKSVNITEAIKRVKNFLSVDNNTFDVRRPFLKSLLGNSGIGKDSLWGGVPTYSEVSRRLQDPTLAEVPFGSVVAMIRLHGKPEVRKTDEKDKLNHESYPYTIEAPKVDFYLLDGAYPVTDVVPEINLKNGSRLEFSNYIKTYGEEQGLRNYVRQINLSPRTERISDAQYKEKLKYQNRKINNTAKRIANDAFTEFKKLKADIISNPDDYKYDPQSVSDKRHDLSNMTLQDVVVDQSIDKLLGALNKGNEFAVLSAIELIERYNKLGQDTRPVFTKLREAGTGIGQLLRQFAELKTTGEGIANTVLKNVQSMNLDLTDDQIKELYKLAKEFEIARTQRNDARIEFLNDSTYANKAKLDVATSNLADKLRDLTVFTGKITPMGIDKMLTTMLQGNLLVPKSLIANVVGNIVNVTKYPEKVAGSLAAYAYNRLWRKNPVSAIEMFWGSGLNSTATFFGSVPTAIKNAATGKMNDDLQFYEVKRNLQPFNSLIQLFTQQGRATLPVRNGKVPFSVWFEKALEASPMAMNAELMFRALYAGDQPFRNSAKLASQWTVYAENGGKAKYGSFERFLNQIDPSDAKRIERMVNESTFTEEGELYKMVQPVLNALSKSADVIASGSPALRGSLSAFLKVMGKTTIPYVKVPANLIQRSLEYSMPIFPLLKGLNLLRQGDQRRAAEMFTRAFIGYKLKTLLTGMYAAGVLIAGASDDDDAERSLKYEEKPNGINVDAFKRYLSATQDPNNPKKQGDRIWDFTKFGIVGIVAAIVANAEQEKQRNPAENPFDQFTQNINSVLSGALEMSFLQGALNTSEEFSKNGITGVATEMLASGSSIFIPNNYGVLTKSQAPYILRGRDQDAIKQLQEKMSLKMIPTLENNSTAVYPIISMFGDPVTQTPAGHNPVLYNFFNITNGKEINDPLSVEMLNLYSRYKADKPAITAPTPTIKLSVGDEEDSYRIDEGDYTYLQMIAGRSKRFEINLSKDDPDFDWSNLPDDEKHEELSRINAQSNEDAKEFMRERIEQGLEDGTIVADPKKGTYHYVKKPAFDWDFYEKNKADFEINP